MKNLISFKLQCVNCVQIGFLKLLLEVSTFPIFHDIAPLPALFIDAELYFHSKCNLNDFHVITHLHRSAATSRICVGSAGAKRPHGCAMKSRFPCASAFTNKRSRFIEFAICIDL